MAKSISYGRRALVHRLQVADADAQILEIPEVVRELPASHRAASRFPGTPPPACLRASSRRSRVMEKTRSSMSSRRTYTRELLTACKIAGARDRDDVADAGQASSDPHRRGRAHPASTRGLSLPARRRSSRTRPHPRWWGCTPAAPFCRAEQRRPSRQSASAITTARWRIDQPSNAQIRFFDPKIESAA